MKYTGKYDGGHEWTPWIEDQKREHFAPNDDPDYYIDHPDYHWPQLPPRRFPKPGLEPIPGYKRPCCHPSHNPPMHLWIPPGQQYRHVCPACGYMIILRGMDIMCIV